ncbi:MAG: right-handed parallel beta-helix repeat-containing protein [Planctomyces sp.]|nr:right-handed parallel beta-helix repeat-containing protein [Planctomyces sp.]
MGSFVFGILVAALVLTSAACETSSLWSVPPNAGIAATAPDITAPDITATERLSIADYPTIQAALDANPGRVLHVPSGDHLISEKIRIYHNESGLEGPGRIVQTQFDQPIIEIEGAKRVLIRDLTLTRPEQSCETHNEGILAIKSADLYCLRVKVINNRTHSAAVALRECDGASIRDCLIENYMRVSVDDRTANPDWGYAFNCTDGTGISVVSSQRILIDGCSIIERNFVPTRELQQKHRLGEFVHRNPQKGAIVSQQLWDAGYTENWQQGSGIIITSPDVSRQNRIVNNQITNAAQGIDLHCDQTIVTGNIISNSFIGMKAMHGSRNILISGNQFSRNSLWAVGLMPGVSSETSNSDGGSIISSNIISGFGTGDAAWIWGTERAPLRFDRGQKVDDPALSNVIVSQNLIDDTAPATFAYSVIIEAGPGSPTNLFFSDNVFPAGSQGISNVPLQP